MMGDTPSTTNDLSKHMNIFDGLAQLSAAAFHVSLSPLESTSLLSSSSPSSTTTATTTTTTTTTTCNIALPISGSTFSSPTTTPKMKDRDNEKEVIKDNVKRRVLFQDFESQKSQQTTPPNANFKIEQYSPKQGFFSFLFFSFSILKNM